MWPDLEPDPPDRRIDENREFHRTFRCEVGETNDNIGKFSKGKRLTVLNKSRKVQNNTPVKKSRQVQLSWRKVGAQDWTAVTRDKNVNEISPTIYCGVQDVIMESYEQKQSFDKSKVHYDVSTIVALPPLTQVPKTTLISSKNRSI